MSTESYGDDALDQWLRRIAKLGEELRSAQQRAEAAEAERDALKSQQRDWLAANGPGGWIDDLRKERDALKADALRHAIGYKEPTP